MTSWDPNERYLSEADWADLGSYRGEVAELAMSMRGLLPMGRENRRFYRSAFANAEGLEEYAAAIPPRDELKEPVDYASPSGNSLHSALERQAQLTVLAFKTGVAVSADLWLGGFDTHGTHDPDHEWLLEHLTDGVDYLWEYAEEHGIANRMVVVMGSDFGRTNKYNSQEGKDHWPIGSFVCDAEGPALDEPGGRRDGRTALRAAEVQPGVAATGRQRYDHPSETCAQGTTTLSGNREFAGGAALPVQQHGGLGILQLSESPAAIGS